MELISTILDCNINVCDLVMQDFGQQENKRRKLKIMNAKNSKDRIWASHGYYPLIIHRIKKCH